MELTAQFMISNGMMKPLRETLDEAISLNNIQLHRITSALVWIGEGRSMREVADLLKVSTKTVSTWFWKFARKGFSWLCGFHYQGRGRKSKLSQSQKRKLYDMVAVGPEANGFDCGIWNSVMIVDLIFREFGVKYNPRYLCSLLKGMGLSFQKAKFISDRAGTGEHEEARRIWQEETWPRILKEAVEKNAVIVFTDEVSFAWWGSVARTWAPKGKQPVVRTSGKRRGLKIFGAIEFQSGKLVTMEAADKFNGETYLQFHKHLLKHYKRPVMLIEDGAPYHKNKIVREFREQQEQMGKLFVFRLPSYSPDLNPIEKVWKNTKRDATHLKYFETFEALRKSVTQTFKKYVEAPQKITAVMKKLRNGAKGILGMDSFS